LPMEWYSFLAPPLSFTNLGISHTGMTCTSINRVFLGLPSVLPLAWHTDCHYCLGVCLIHGLPSLPIYPSFDSVHTFYFLSEPPQHRFYNSTAPKFSALLYLVASLCSSTTVA
jgi:hypothetical protein